MLILSTFTSNYLQSPLKALLEFFKPQPVNIKYVNTNLIGELINLKLNSEEKNSFAILFRINDFTESSDINLIRLEEHLDLIVKKITVLKQKEGLPILVFLCPSSRAVYDNNPILETLEKKIIKNLNENKIHTLTLSNIKERYGDIEFENPIEEDTHIPYIPKFYAAIASLLARKLHAINQRPYKVIAVDCDNTLWDGVAGDLGVQGVLFKEHNIFLQKYLVEQQKKGIIICLCSKNEEETVLAVFKQRQSEMILKWEHINKYKINWEEKAENIKQLALDLNVFPDSFLFIDDNPIEINNVKQIPGIACITMPQSLQKCKEECLFDMNEHVIITETDKNRSKLLKQDRIKTALATQFRDPIEYLRSEKLGQSIVISKIKLEEIETIERVSQLSGKTNQFNSFPEIKGNSIHEINKMITCDKKEVFVGRIKDNISPEDITAISMCSIDSNHITIDNFFVSCRSFNRGIEFEMLKHIAQMAKEMSIKNIKIKFKKSNKNKAAGLFFNILSGINKDLSSAPLLNTSINQPLFNIIFACFKFLKKRNHHIDFNSFELNKEAILTFSAQKLIELDLDFLVGLSLRGSPKPTQAQQNIELDNNVKINENYLIELNQMTSSLDYLVNNFFIDNNIIKSLAELENRVNTICANLLGEKGLNKSLVKRGLDSLKATELRYYLYESDSVNIAISQLLCPKMTAFNLIEYIKGQKRIIKPVPQNDNFDNQTLPVSFQQRRIWLAEHKEQASNSANFHMTACYKVSKNIDILRFKLACQKLIKLYDVFGTSFFMQEGALKQAILAPEERKLNFIEVALTEISLEKAVELEISKPWTMTSKDPLIHIILFKDSNYHIFFHVHHAIFDAVSLKNFLDTLSKTYHDNNLLFSKPPQYSEFIAHQQKKLADKAYQSQIIHFWQNELSKIEAVTTLPVDQSLSALKPATEQVAERYIFSLASTDFLSLKALAQSTSVTCFSIIYALLGILIASYTYQKNITLLTATNGRDGDPSFNKMIGFFVNLLVCQFDLEEHQTLNEYLKYVNEKVLNSQKFQDIPFDEILKILHTQGINDILLSPAFIYQSYTIPELKIENKIAELELPKHTIIFDERKTCRFGHFTLFAQEDYQRLNFIIEYAKDLFSTSFIERFSKNFLHMIRQVIRHPDQILKEISIVCDDERKQLINLGQGPKLEYAKEDNLISGFQRSVEKYPDLMALCYDKTCLSYKEVDQQSKNLAYALTEAGVKQGDHVGIYLAPNHLFFIAELAVLKIGAVFIPLSKEDPDERLKLIIDDAKIKSFIVDNISNGLFDKDFKEYRLISIDQINTTSNELPSITITMEDMACILYTSGSTGKPKGVILPQKAIFRVIETLSGRVKLGDEIAQTANQVFDAAQLEFFLAVLNAAKLIIFNKNVLLDENLFSKKLSDEKIKIIWLTAGLFNLYALKSPKIFKKVHYLMSGGDVVDVKAVEKTLAANPTLQFINGYGPTETGIFALTYTANQENLKKFSSVPIGAPTIAGTQVFLLNIFNRLAPWNAIGQLGISGDGLGGYYNNKSLQEKCFLPFPENIMFSPKEKPKQMYLSGDKVQIMNDKIFYFGRIVEEQIKIHGNLVSLPEIKKALEKHPAIKQAEIIYKKINSKNKALVVFYTKNEASLKPNKKELIEFLSNLLSPTMIPMLYEIINTFQITANGKLDRSALSKLPLTIKEESDTDEGNRSENLKEIQKKLLSIFEDIFKDPENILHYTSSLRNNFFHVGGDSIKAVQLITKIEENIGKKITFDTLRMNSTIDALSHFLERDKDQEQDRLSLLYKGTDEMLPPIVFMHPAGGGLFCFSKLIDVMKEARLNNYCYGIEDPVILERQVKALTIPEMAKNYLQYINEKIKGPFVLTGYSFGGMLALEMAAQLEQCNQNCLSVILLDTWVVSCANENLKEALRSHVLAYCEEIIQKVSTNTRVNKIENLIPTMVKQLMEQCQYYQEIGFVFKPKKLVSTPVTLFKVKDTDKFKDMQEETQYNYLESFIESKNLAKYEVEGDHFNLLEKDANVDFLGKKIVGHVKDIFKSFFDAKNSFFQRTGSDMNLHKMIPPEQSVLIRRN